MRTIRTKVYSFDELSSEAKDRAIEQVRQSNYETDNPLWFFEEDCTYKAEEIGFKETSFQWSLGYCQGDGLSFSSKRYDNLKELYLKVLGEGKEKTAKLLAENTTFILKGNTGRYCYASKDDVELYIENYTSSINTDCERINEVVQKVEQELQEIYYNLCKQLEHNAYEIIEYSQTDEAIIEDIEANEYEFLKDGTRYL